MPACCRARLDLRLDIFKTFPNCLTMDEDSGSDSSWDSADNADHVEELDAPSTCLFCPQIEANCERVFLHIKSVHQFDVVSECRSRSLDSIDFIKLVNYVRKEKVPPQAVFVSEAQWRTCDTYMKPVVEDDQLLRYDIETAINSPDKPAGQKVENLRKKIGEYQDKINSLQGTVESMRVSMQIIVGDRDQSQGDCPPKKKCTNYENDSYFSSYSHFGIHHEMLSDVVRTRAYQDAIVKNPQVFTGKEVLDIGCGTGILSLFSATAGARRVLAVDESDMAFYAMTIATENKLQQQIEVDKRKLEELPTDRKYDIIVSEWMGYFLLFEGMLDTIIYARKNLLAPGGLILPNRCSLTIAGISDRQFYQKHVYFWDDVYGYKMTSLKHVCMQEAIISVVAADKIITEPCDIKHIDVMTCTLEETQTFESTFSLRCTKASDVHAICGWFECYFDAECLTEKVCLSTSPRTQETHWKQTLFLLKSPIALLEGAHLEGKVSVSRMEDNARALRVIFTFVGVTEPQEFFMM